MPIARHRQVALSATPYYHCIGRCVRRAFLWGKDDFSGRDFSHRKLWVTERLAELAQVFAINLCAYAIMSNHYHLVLHVDAEKAQSWSDTEVAVRWAKLFTLPGYVEQVLKGQASAAEQHYASQFLSEIRRRLSDLSWYMRCLNEPIARRANQEDHCTGRFWEGRFKSQAILDEAGLLACCMYVDLNPVRAGIVSTLEASDFTGVQQRLFEHADKLQQTSSAQQADAKTQAHNAASSKRKARHHALPAEPSKRIAPPLHPFGGSLSTDPAQGLPFKLSDYLELADWTARILRADKRGATPAHLPPILQRLGFDSAGFLSKMQSQALKRGYVIGQIERLQAFAEHLQLKRRVGISLHQVAAA